MTDPNAVASSPLASIVWLVAVCVAAAPMLISAWRDRDREH